MKSYCVREKKETNSVPGSEEIRLTSNGRRMLASVCSSCGSKKTQFVSGQVGGALDYACGINLRGKRPGTIEECFKSGQIRRYGLNAVNLDTLLADKLQKAKAARMAISKDPIRSEFDRLIKKDGNIVRFQDIAIRRVARNKYDLMTEEGTIDDLTKSQIIDILSRAYGDALTKSYQQRQSRKTFKPKKPLLRADETIKMDELLMPPVRRKSAKTPSVWTAAKQKEYVDEIIADIKAKKSGVKRKKKNLF